VGAFVLVIGALLVSAPSAPAQGDTPVYAIGARDILAITVLGQAQMTGDFLVDRDGMISFPAVGRIRAAGLSAAEFEKGLTTILTDGYLKRPQVTVEVKEYNSQRVTVAGEVTKPGVYPLRNDPTLRALLLQLGVLGPNAGHEVLVIRQLDAPESVAAGGGIPTDTEAAESDSSTPGAEPQQLSFSVQRVLAGMDNIVLRNEDTVFVPKAKLVYVSGHVAKPGPLRYEEGMTVLQALSLAGGVTSRGAEGRLKVIRIIDGERKQFKPKLADPVNPEDTIVVPERFF